MLQFSATVFLMSLNCCLVWGRIELCLSVGHCICCYMANLETQFDHKVDNSEWVNKSAILNLVNCSFSPDTNTRDSKVTSRILLEVTRTLARKKSNGDLFAPEPRVDGLKQRSTPQLVQCEKVSVGRRGDSIKMSFKRSSRCWTEKWWVLNGGKGRKCERLLSPSLSLTQSLVYRLIGCDRSSKLHRC